MSSRTSYFLLTAAAWTLLTAIANATSIAPASLSGSWELRTACMNDHGRPGACIEMKPGSLQFTFVPDGKWSSAAQDPNRTKKAGTYEVRANKLILKNSDGSLYQNWQPNLSDDGQQFIVVDKQLIETFVRIKPTESPLE